MLAYWGRLTLSKTMENCMSNIGVDFLDVQCAAPNFTLDFLHVISPLFCVAECVPS